MAKRIRTRTSDSVTDPERVTLLAAAATTRPPAAGATLSVTADGPAATRPAARFVKPGQAEEGLDSLPSNPSLAFQEGEAAAGDGSVPVDAGNSTVLLAPGDGPILLAQTSGPSGSVFDAGMPPRAPAPAAGAATAAAAGGGVSLGTVLLAGVALGAAAGGGGGGGGSSSSTAADTTPPAAPVINTVAGNDRINANEKAAGITLTGTAEAGSTVSVTLGATTRTAVTASGGAWSVDFTTAQIPVDGPVTVLATARDAAGNTSAETTRAIVVDTTPPVLQSVLVQATPGALLLTYDESIDPLALPATSVFEVLVDGIARGITSVSASGAVVTVSVVGDIAPGARVEFAYTDATADNDGLAIQDLAGNDAASLNLAGGLVSDGYLRAASVYRDTDLDGVPAAGELVATTNRSGQFFAASGGSGDWLARDGVSADTGIPNTLALSAPAQATVINPLTTLAQAMRSLPAGPADIVVAAQRLVASLGLVPGARGLYGTDIVDEGGEAQRAALQVAALNALAGSGTFIAGVASDLLRAGTLREAVSLEDSFVLARLLASASASQASAAADAATRIGLAGSLSEATLAQARALDAAAPASPTGFTGPAATQDTSPAVTVTFDSTSLSGAAAVAGDRVTILAGEGAATRVLASRALAAGEATAGQAIIDLPVLGEGAYTLRAVLTDGVGRESGLSTSLALQVDTRAPLAPVVLPVAGDDIIGIAEAPTAVISGGAEPGSTITVSFSGVSRTTTASNAGAWSYALTASDLAIMGQGNETVSVVATDAAGNVSAATTRDIVVDTVAPTLSVVIGTVLNDIGVSISNGQGSTDNTLELRGTVSALPGAGDRVFIYESGTLLASVSAPGGAWSYVTPGLADNRVSEFTARLVDSAGNAGPLSSAYRVDVAAFVPFARAVIGTESGATAIVQPTLNGTVTQSLGLGEVVRVYDAGLSLPGFATFSDETNWSYTLPLLGDGTRQLRAVVEDATMNQSAPSAQVTLVVDTTAPAAPVIDVVAFNDHINAAERTAGVTVRGSAEPGSEVTINLGALATRIVTAASGQWATVFLAGDIPDVSPDSLVLTATARDDVGNVSAQGTRTVQVDIVAPVVALAAPGGADGILSTADLAAGADFTATAAGAAGVVLQITTAGGATVVREMTSGGGAQWHYALAASDLAVLGQGVATVRARAFDAVGNVGAESTQAVTFDSVAPQLSPFTLSAVSDTGRLGDGRSSVPRPQITFTAESGAQVSFDPGTGAFGAPVAATGAAQTLQDISDLPAEGRYTLRLQATDAAGNISERVATYVYDLTGPEIVHAQRTGAVVVLTGSEGLQEGAASEALFTVEVAGVPVPTPASVQVAGRSASVTLASAPAGGDAVSLAYAPGAGGLADASGNSAAAFRVVVGTPGADTLVGSADADLLVGGAGVDTLSGGGGNDTFAFALGEATPFEQGSGPAGSVVWTTGALDRIVDAASGDRLRLDALLDMPGGLALSGVGETIVAEGGIIVVRGDYDAMAGAFTQSSSGTATLLAWDSASSTDIVTPAGIVLDTVVSFSTGTTPGLLVIL